jgi:hypothetical protein
MSHSCGAHNEKKVKALLEPSSQCHDFLRMSSFAPFHFCTGFFLYININIMLMVNEQTYICQDIGEYLIHVEKHYINTNMRNSSHVVRQILLT